VSAPLVDTSVIRDIVAGSKGSRNGGGAISIKGVSAGPVTVEVQNLAPGTTPADVEMIFSQCGKVISSILPDSQPDGSVTVHVKFEDRSEALGACKTFDGQQADGHVLRVALLVAEQNVVDRFGAKRAMEVDILPDDGPRGGSKMYSDALVANDPRAQVLTRPPNAGNAGRGRRGGRAPW